MLHICAMKFSIVGTGNAAWHFAEMLTKGGHSFLQVFGRNKQATSEISERFGAVTIDYLRGFTSENDFVVLAVSDSSIAEVSKEMDDDIFTVHASGAGSIDLLSQPQRGVIWPVQSLVKYKTTDYSRIPFLIEASDKKDEALLTVMMKNISGQVVIADSAQRLKAHTAAVFANNFTNALFDISESVLAQTGLPRTLFISMIEGHINKLKHFPAAQLQTGPAKRNDHETIEKHMANLQDNHHEKEIYSLLTKYIQQKFYGNQL